MLLELKEISKRFGGLAAINQFSMNIEHGQITGLIGPNGAGKTTIFNLITGVIHPDAGTVFFNNVDITGKSPHFIARLGIGRTFQLTPLFADFTMLDNVVASCYLNPCSGFWSTLFNTRSHRNNESLALDQAFKTLELVGLGKVQKELAKNLSHGYQKMLGIARALAVQPKLLMLDEPLGGMNTDEIASTIDIMP